MTEIVTELGKLRYNRFPMGMCSLGDIFQAKVDDLLGDIKATKTYINDILLLSKDFFKKHIYRMRIIFGRLCAAGLKVSGPKFSFWLKDIPYLVYVIKSEVIKPDPKKVKGIMDIGGTATTTEAQALIGMVQYHMDRWIRRSNVLASLIEETSGSKSRKKCGMKI